MFHSAAIKLTGWYLIIIMALSIGCSLTIYHFSSDELARDNRRQAFFLNNNLPGPAFQNFAQLRATQLSDSRGHLKTNLIAFNFLVLAGGGIASYALARRTLQPIEESHEAQKRFAADASHELRTPLTAMQTEIEVALRNPKLTKQQATNHLRSNLEEVAKLKTLSEGLLKLASQESKAHLDQVVNLKDVVRDATDRLSKVAKAKQVNITAEIADINVWGDQPSLGDLAAILLDNAIKYSAPKSKILIKTGVEAKSGYLQIVDSGVGIEAANLPRIFDRFYRADTSRSKDGANGYGLGLALAKKIADMHHGSIEVESTPGRGSAFTLHLPLA